MSVTVLLDPPAYNKAPKPEKAPNEKLHPNKLIIESDQHVWVSVPQVDKLHLSIELRPEHFIPGLKVETFEDYGRMLMQSLATGHAGPVKHTKYIEHAHLYTQAQVLFGEAQQPVFFTIKKTPKKPHGAHTLMLQLNPRLLTEEGIFELIDRLYKVTGKQLLVGAMLADARVSRLDVAVDIVGVEIADVLVRLKNESKRNYRATAAGLQSIEIWPKGTTSATAQNRAVIVYDKRAERLEAGETPPHDPAPVMRIEVTKKRFGNAANLLVNLAKLKNPLKAVAVGHVRAAACPLSRSFLCYVDARRVFGTGRAAANLGLKPETASQFEKWYLTHPSDLFDGASIWEGWADGLMASGTYLLIEAAQKKSAGVPPPDFPSE